MRLPALLSIAILPLAVAACGGTAPMPPTIPPPSPSATPAPSASAAAAPAATDFSGVWLGTLQAGAKALRLQLRIDLSKTPPNPPSCFLDSLDQHASMPCSEITVTETTLKIGVSAVNGTLAGTASPDGNTITATWTQGGRRCPSC